ncbi:MAG: VOC family protein [Rubrivivax sp.]
MSATQVDHLVVAARTLEEGAAWCEATLGVPPGPGGKHPLMSTHNRLLKISSERFPDSFLEIIAIDPEAPPPGRVRWFGLDEIDLSAGPRLIHMVARSTMLDMHRWGLINVGLQPGTTLAASRETPAGTLSWQIVVREDGRLLCSGALPTLIQWSGRHPTAAMPDSGVALESLALAGVGERARDVLRLVRVGVTAAPGVPITAQLRTPKGLVTLESAAP